MARRRGEVRDIGNELYRKLSPVAADWKLFGVQLGLELAELDKLVTLNKKSEVCFLEMMKYYMDNGLHQWEEIFDALKYVNQSGLAKNLYSRFAAEDQNLRDLTKELSKVEHCWFRFGTFLGIGRDKLKSIEERKSNEEYLQEVIDMWRNKYDHIDIDQLEEIFTALKNIHKSVLARELKDYFTGHNQLPRHLVATDDNIDNAIDEQEEIIRRLECVHLNNEQQYSHPVQATSEGNTETGALSNTSQIYPEPIDKI